MWRPNLFLNDLNVIPTYPTSEAFFKLPYRDPDRLY